jgi:hypothetical protein
MLNAIATKNDNAKISKIVTDKVKLSVPQRALVENIRAAGGSLAGADLEEAGDTRTLNALLKKGVVTKEGRGKKAVWALTNVTVEAEEIEENPLASCENFREACEDVLGYGYQSKLARTLGVNKATVGKWMQGLLPVPTYAIAFIASLQHMQDAGVALPDFVQ